MLNVMMRHLFQRIISRSIDQLKPKSVIRIQTRVNPPTRGTSNQIGPGKELTTAFGDWRRLLTINLDHVPVVLHNGRREPKVYAHEGGLIKRQQPPLIEGAVEEEIPVEDYYYVDGFLDLSLWRVVCERKILLADAKLVRNDA